MECKRCLFTDDFAKILPDGECEYCKLHDKLESQAKPSDLEPILKKIRKRKGQYNCLIGISGGLDSSVLLYTAVKIWKLRPLVIHFDNNWNDSAAAYNINALINKLNVNAIIYRLDKNEYDTLNHAFLAAGVPDADIPNDIAMTKLMYDTANKYGIKYILNGHDFRQEGSTPAKWTYMDAKYIQDVYKQYAGTELKNYPLLTFFDQIFYGLKGIKQVRPFHYGFDRIKIERDMRKEIGFKDYGPKHCENIYTEYVGTRLLPEKFGIDKRIVYLSALIRTGIMNKTVARSELGKQHKFNIHKLADQKKKILELEKSSIKDRSLFKRYNFKKYRIVIWFLAKLKVVPYTFYKKYCF